MARRSKAAGMRDGYLRGTLARPATQGQMDVFAAFVAAGGSVQGAAALVGIRPSTVKRHLADLRSSYRAWSLEQTTGRLACRWDAGRDLAPEVKGLFTHDALERARKS